MMTPDLSRRLAGAMFVANPEVKMRRRLVHAAERAGTWSKLPAWAKQFVRAAERV